MEAAVEGGWIATERTHPLYLVQVLGSSPIVAIILVYLWLAVLVPQFGTVVAAVTVIATALACGAIDLWTWTIFRPVAVRVTPAGVEIRRTFAAVFSIPSEKLVLRARPPEGFGFVASKEGFGFILSPYQFSAAKRYFPVEDVAAEPPAPPLR